MKKLTGYEQLVVVLTAVFLLVCGIRFWGQGASGSGVRIETQRADSSLAPAPQPDKTDDGLLPGEVIDLNSASLSDLLRLPGIGPARAQAILDHIADRGPLSSVDDLLSVSGIGQATLEALRPHISAGDE